MAAGFRIMEQGGSASVFVSVFLSLSRTAVAVMTRQ